ncbi:DUF1456 family protein [Lentisphaera marina]|uniref:DUF1456 family protein n=1 Tax=Lentisphaera marina TaxID=1111041 RepID=UPI0023671C2A|nr:DUF1456 family protein [Lentisphaera marina]MDD7985570.1 DUF1456 family protein [Lentisphaera marina]
MTHNDILRRLRFTLNINNEAIIDLVTKGGGALSMDKLDKYLKREDEEGYEECSAKDCAAFLDGVILWKRGPQEGGGPKKKMDFDNNMILRKLRIAFELKDVDMLAILDLAGMPISKSELSAFFRAPKHRNYMQVQSQLLRRFMVGLDKYLRQ